MKRLLSLLLAAALTVALASGAAAYADDPGYTDLPAEGWARDAILSAYDYGLMGGMGDGSFGVGRSMTRAEFVTVLVRMFGWGESAGADAFTDISGSWARGYINAAAANGAVDAGGTFRPDEAVTRREMAVMLVRALGYGEIAQGTAASLALPFTDVTENRGYIAIAYDIGMTNGVSATAYGPEATAKREEAAAMMVRIYQRQTAPTDFTHAFYAISSYSQLELAKTFDAVSLGWSRLVFSPETGADLETTSAGGTNEYAVPSGYEEAVRALEDAGVKLHLSVYMNNSGGALATMLADPNARTAAADAILAELERTYDALGYNPYTGVTLDLEGLRAAQRADYTSFLTELDSRLERAGKTLYVAVQPATADGVYYDGYDYRAIGELADKVILMAHDYSARSMEGFVGTKYHETAALAPIGSVYYSLRAVCDDATGVADRSKVVLAVSIANQAWEVDAEGRLTSPVPLYPTTATVYSRLAGGAEMGWSETYQSPYLRYVTEEGQNIFLWYEDQRSVEAKVDLARMFGVTGVSLWRLGIIPDYQDPGLFYDVTEVIR